MRLSTVFKCFPQTFDYNLSSSSKRSIVIASLAVKTAYLVPRRAKRGVYRRETSAESACFSKTEPFLCFPFASSSTIILRNTRNKDGLNHFHISQSDFPLHADSSKTLKCTRIIRDAVERYSNIAL